MLQKSSENWLRCFTFWSELLFCFLWDDEKKSVLPIFETSLQKSFVKDPKNFRGTCCFSISENLVTIHLTYAENGFLKLAVFFGGHLLYV